jgi:hypothetical protein
MNKSYYYHYVRTNDLTVVIRQYYPVGLGSAPTLNLIEQRTLFFWQKSFYADAFANQKCSKAIS